MDSITPESQWLIKDILIVAAALTAIVIFILKIGIDIWVELGRRMHLCNALYAYVSNASERYETVVGAFNFDAVKQMIEERDDYTPYILFDPVVGFSLQDIRQEYGFLDNDVMRQVVRYLTAENYIQSICNESKSEYVRGFPKERKVKFLEVYDDALHDVRVQAGKAEELMDEMAGRSRIIHIRKALF